MKRLQIRIEPELDDALPREASRRSMSKAALVRLWIADRVQLRRAIEDDPIWGLVGLAGSDVEPEDIDEVVYGRSH